MNRLPGETVTFQLKPNQHGLNTATLYVHPFKGTTTKAVLYVHGFNDYFFQEHVADWFSGQGIQFFALDLRRYGRSLLPHQKPNGTHDLTEYFEELSVALNYMEIKGGIKSIVLMGHSTGGLITSLFCVKYQTEFPIKALILNSPFFAMNLNGLEKILLPAVAFLGKYLPTLASPSGLTSGYGKSIHKQYEGEWDFDLNIKPVEGYPVDLGWVNTIYSTQQILQKGLDIRLPVLVIYSSKSVSPGDFREEMLTADSVLNVKDIAHYANRLGSQVTKKVISDGIHDLLLSRLSARKEAFSSMEDFLKFKTVLYHD